MGHRILAYATVNSPVGQLVLVATPQGLCRLGIGESAEEVLAELSPFEVVDSSADLELAIRQLNEYFQGTRRRFDLRFDLGDATDFQAKVYRALCEIPYGETRSYAWVARRINKPAAARAVGQACRVNPLPVFIPCHRVVSADGTLGGYSSGLDIKRKLLDLETGLAKGEADGET